MSFPIVPFITFSLVTIFTPGPNNISSMGFGAKYGYRGTLKYLLGICIGAFTVFMIGGFFSSLLGRYIPKFFPYLKYVGAAYIVFLGIQVMRSSLVQKEGAKSEARFYQGILLQFLNVKGIIYCLTVFTVFIHPHYNNILINLMFAGILNIAVFASVSLYTMGGNVIKLLVKRERVYKAINIVLGLALIYSAVAIVLSDVSLKGAGG
jgi:cysteine/O-acetylserine efflux protein